MQFINNNLVRQELVEAVILSVLLTVLAWMLSRKKESVDEEQCDANRLHAEELKNPKNPQKAAMLLVILVALMTCIFATLDNAVTMARRGYYGYRAVASSSAGVQRTGSRLDF